jgi:hypothetical protein
MEKGSLDPEASFTSEAVVNPKAFEFISRFLSPETLNQLRQTGIPVIENADIVKNDPIYWMNQLILLEDLDINVNDPELRGVDWETLYKKVKKDGVSQLLYSDNPKVVQICLNADNYSPSIITDAICETVKKDNISGMKILVTSKFRLSRVLDTIRQYKNNKAFGIILSSEHGDDDNIFLYLSDQSVEHFDLFIKNKDIKTPKDIIEYVDMINFGGDTVSSTGDTFLEEIVIFNNINLVEHLLHILFVSNVSLDFKLNFVQGILQQAVVLNRSKIIDMFPPVQDKLGENVLDHALMAGNDVVVRKYINAFIDISPEKAFRYLNFAIMSENSRTIQIVLDKFKTIKIVKPRWIPILLAINNIKNIKILQQVIENIRIRPTTLEKASKKMKGWKEGYEYITNILSNLEQIRSNEIPSTIIEQPIKSPRKDDLIEEDTREGIE